MIERLSSVRRLGAMLALVLLSLGMTRAQTVPLRVATRVVPPFVMRDADRWSGFSIDLWNSISRKLNVTSTYLDSSDVNGLLESVQTGKADLGIAAISITAERDKQFDFSQPMFDAGLQILTPVSASTQNPILALLNEFRASGILNWIASIFILGLIPAHIVWLFERRNPNGFLTKRSYFPGIFQAYWWSLSTLATQAEEMPKGALSRVVAVIWMFSAVVFIAFFTAQVTTSMTVQQLQGAIKGPEDLPGKTVATTTGSTSAEYLRQHGSRVEEYPNIEQAYDATEKGDADAVVYDSPVLLYYVGHEGKGKFQIVGDVFRKESYGIAFPSGSRLRKPVETALLSLKEDGTYQDLYDKWFASK